MSELIPIELPPRRGRVYTAHLLPGDKLKWTSEQYDRRVYVMQSGDGPDRMVLWIDSGYPVIETWSAKHVWELDDPFRSDLARSNSLRSALAAYSWAKSDLRGRQ